MCGTPLRPAESKRSATADFGVFWRKRRSGTHEHRHECRFARRAKPHLSDASAAGAQRPDAGSLRKLTPWASGPRPMTMQPMMRATAAKPPIDWRVREVLAEHRLEIRHDAGAQHAELIGEPGEKAAQVRRRQLVDVRRDDAPRALHEELHQESAGHDQRGASARATHSGITTSDARARRRSSRGGGRSGPST